MTKGRTVRHKAPEMGTGGNHRDPYKYLVYCEWDGKPLESFECSKSNLYFHRVTPVINTAVLRMKNTREARSEVARPMRKPR